MPAMTRAASMRRREMADAEGRAQARSQSMLIAQLGHIAELAAADWLVPNVRNPDRSGAEAWIGEMLAEPHTREQLQALLRVSRPHGL